MPVILVIDDNPHMAQLIQDMVELSGYDTEVAFSGLEGLDKAKAGMPDLILVDVNMPVMDGWQLYHKLRESSSIPVIFVTAHDTPESVKKAKDIGASGLIGKMLTPNQLAQQIQFVLGEQDSDKVVYVH